MIELRDAEMPWGEELDEVVAEGAKVHLHAEDMGQGISIILNDGPRIVNVWARLERMPRALWWEEIKDAWLLGEWPCFWRVKLELMEDHTPWEGP